MKYSVLDAIKAEENDMVVKTYKRSKETKGEGPGPFAVTYEYYYYHRGKDYVAESRLIVNSVKDIPKGRIVKIINGDGEDVTKIVKSKGGK